MICLILLVGVYCLHMILKMHWITTGIVFAYLFVMLWFHRRQYRKIRRERLRFAETSEYLDSLLYAFSKEEKVERALCDVEAALVDGPMRQTVREALAHLRMTFDDTDVMRASLRMIEEAYPCARLETVHDFMIHVENYGGRIERPVNLLLADKKRWEGRVLHAMKDRNKMFTDIVLSIAASLGICGIILYMPVMDMDISGSLLCQILTVIVIVLDDLIFLRAQKYMAPDWLKLDVMSGDEDARAVQEYYSYNAKKGKCLSVVLMVPCLLGGAWAFWSGRQMFAAAALLLSVLMLNQHRVGRYLARRNLVKSIKCAFPNWLMDIVLLLQSENVQMAVIKSRAHVPPVLALDLERLCDRLAMEPEAASPYHEFLQEFAISEVHAAMSMLFSISMGHSNQADRQIGELIDRNLEMLDVAEKERIANLSSGMYLLFLAPVLTASLKLVIDMAVFMLSFLTSAGI